MMIIKNSIIYLGSSIFSKAIPFLLLPIMTKYLSTEAYGILSIYLLFITLFTSLIGMNMQANISRNFHKVNQEELSKYIGNILYILVFTFIMYQFILFIVDIFYDKLFTIDIYWYYLASFIALMMIINQLNLTILRNEERAKIYGIFEVLNTAIKFSITVVLLICFYMGWESQVYGILVSSFLFAIIGYKYMKKRKYVTIALDKEKIKSILKISIPMIPYSLSGIVILMSDRLFIENMLGLEEVGLYSVGYSFGMIVVLFTDAFIKAWSPWFYRQLTSESFEKKLLIVKYSYIYFMGLLIITILVSMLSTIIFPYFVDNKFSEAKNFIIYIAIAFAFRGVYQIFFPYLVNLGKTNFLAISMFVAAIVNILFNYIFINQFGTIGAAYSTILSFFVSSIMMLIYQQKNYKMPWLYFRKNNVS